MLAACEHTEPFRPDDGGTSGPLNPGPPVQVTFSPGQDLIPAWLPDGSGFVYTAERRDRADHDRCFAFMPVAAGTISRYACGTVAADDSINVYDEAAIRDDSIAYVRASTERFLPGLGPDRQELVIAPLANPTAVRVVQRGTATAVMLRGTAPLVASSIQEPKDGPRRLVLNLPNSTSAVAPVTAIGQGPVERLRIGMNPTTPFGTQVTMELSRAASYRASARGSRRPASGSSSRAAGSRCRSRRWIRTSTWTRAR